VKLNTLEQAVLQKLLDGDHPTLIALRAQLEGLVVTRRDLTGVGFFTELAGSKTTPTGSVASADLQFGDVEADIEGLRHGAGFLLYVEGGRLHTLEGYSYDERWPDDIGRFTLRYTSPGREATLAALDRGAGRRAG
jgi:hypothetical protein